MNIEEIILDSVKIGKIKIEDVYMNHTATKSIIYNIDYNNIPFQNLTHLELEFVFNSDIMNNGDIFYCAILYIKNDIKMPYYSSSGLSIKNLPISNININIKTLLNTLLVGTNIYDFERC